MSSYPNSIVEFRTKHNLPGIEYDENDGRTLYVEDVQKIEKEIIAIEEVLGAEVLGNYETVADRLNAISEVNISNKTAYVRNTTNTNSVTFTTLRRKGNILIMNFSFSNKVNITDTTIDIATINLESFNISALEPCSTVAASDGGNSLVMLNVSTGGVISAVDSYVTKPTTSGRTIDCSVVVGVA